MNMYALIVYIIIIIIIIIIILIEIYTCTIIDNVGDYFRI